MRDPSLINRYRQAFWVAGGIALYTFLLYLRTFQFDFVSFDDEGYVYENAFLNAPLTWQTFYQALTAWVIGHWHPITMLSHLFDVKIFGLNAGYHHLHNALLHALNAALLCFILFRATQNLLFGAFVALLFAVHPLNTESVIWISQRKTVLSTMFYFLALLTYIEYAKEGQKNRDYVLTCVFYVLGFFAKPLVVTLPLVMVLFDIWPLQRVQFSRTGLRNQLAEKWVFVFFTLLFCLITLHVQSQEGATTALSNRNTFLIISNVVRSYWVYLAKFFWPTNLAVHHPFSRPLPILGFILFSSALTLLIFWAGISIKRRPQVTMGLFFFILTFLPMIGIVQIGIQGYADRYVYLPYVGLMIPLAWWLLTPPSRAQKLWPKLVLTLAVLAFSVQTFLESANWKNSETLYRHAIQVHPRNTLMYSNFGYWLNRQDRCEEAVPILSVAVALDNRYAEAHNNLAACLMTLNQLDQAEVHVRKAVEARPTYGRAWHNLGKIMQQTGRLDGALKNMQKALEVDPSLTHVLVSIAEVYALMEKIPDATYFFEQGIAFHPKNASARFNLALCYFKLGRIEDAIHQYGLALRLNPSLSELSSPIRKHIEAHSQPKLPQ